MILSCNHCGAYAGNCVKLNPDEEKPGEYICTECEWTDLDRARRLDARDAAIYRTNPHRSRCELDVTITFEDYCCGNWRDMFLGDECCDFQGVLPSDWYGPLGPPQAT